MKCAARLLARRWAVTNGNNVIRLGCADGHGLARTLPPAKTCPSVAVRQFSVFQTNRLLHPNQTSSAFNSSDSSKSDKNIFSSAKESSNASCDEHQQQIVNSTVEDYRQRHDIKITDPAAPDPVFDFQSLGLPERVLQNLSKQFSSPTPIQAQALPLALDGRNMVGIGQTGSGKTLAFLLPALVHVMERAAAMSFERGEEYNGPLALIMAPTRELAKQIEEVANQYRRLCGVRTVCCIGGESRLKQLARYSQRPHIMIATPGRLNDLLDSEDVSISDVGYVVLDEADRMLDMGFEPQIRSILSALKPVRQVLMFSATWPEEVRELAEEFLGEFTFMSIGSTELRANKNITQEVVVCDDINKQEEFLTKIQELKKNKVLIFVERKVAVDRLERILRNRRIWALGIHGDKSQAARSNALRKFKDGTCNIMIATDVAARGLDIEKVEYVINYDFPLDIENYVHRIGRTARSNNTGTSITFITEKEARFAKNLVKVLRESDQPISSELVDLAILGKEEKSANKSRFRPRHQTDPRPTRASLDNFRMRKMQAENWFTESQRGKKRRNSRNPNNYSYDV